MEAFGKDSFERLVSCATALLGTSTRPLIIPGEAILGIEATARNVSAPGRTFLNVVTGPYGKLFGEWLRMGGAAVTDLCTGYDEVITGRAVEEALEEGEFQALSFVQTEAITGGKNPAEEILKTAKRHRLITILDSVSAIGADPVFMDRFEIDFLAAGMQKALGGPNGVSFLGVSERGLQFVRSNPGAVRNSVLSLLDLSERETEGPPENLPTLEARAALDTCVRIEEETLAGVCKRHAKTARAMRGGVKALGLSLWQREETGCTNLNTTVRRPQGFLPDCLRAQSLVTEGNGSLAKSLLRINHYGEQTGLACVRQAVWTLAEGIGLEKGAARVKEAVLAAEEAFFQEP